MRNAKTWERSLKFLDILLQLQLVQCSNEQGGSRTYLTLASTQLDISPGGYSLAPAIARNVLLSQGKHIAVVTEAKLEKL